MKTRADWMVPKLTHLLGFWLFSTFLVTFVLWGISQQLGHHSNVVHIFLWTAFAVIMLLLTPAIIKTSIDFYKIKKLAEMASIPFAQLNRAHLNSKTLRHDVDKSQGIFDDEPYDGWSPLAVKFWFQINELPPGQSKIVRTGSIVLPSALYGTGMKAEDLYLGLGFAVLEREADYILLQFPASQGVSVSLPMHTILQGSTKVTSGYIVRPGRCNVYGMEKN